jgi:TP901 family phage tail tape measure protein
MLLNLAGNFSSKINEHASAFDRFSQRVGNAAKRASNATGKLFSPLAGIDLAAADAQISKYERRVDRARGRLMEAAAAGAMVIAPVVQLSRFEHDLAHFGNITSKTREELALIEDDLRAKAETTNQTAKELLTGIDYLMGKGLDENKSAVAIEQIGIASTATNSQILEMARASFAVISNLSVEAEKLPKALDIMAEAGKRGGFELRDMASHFPKLTAQARNLGMEGEETIAKLAAALQIALKGAGSPDEAANNLNNFLSKLASPETVRKFKDLGIDIRAELDKAVKEGVDPMEYIIVRMHDLAKENPWVVGDVFGDMQVLQFLKPLIADLEEYRVIRDAAFNADGVIQADFDRIMDTKVEQWKRLMIQLDRALTHAEGFAHTVKTIVGYLIQATTAMNDFAAANPELANAIIHLVGGFLALGAALTVLNFLWAITGLQAWRLLRVFALLKNTKITWAGIKVLSWAAKVPKLAWSAFIKTLTWATFLPVLAWKKFIPALSWKGLLGAASRFSWKLLIKPLVWFGKFIPVIGWAFLAADLGLWAWELVIKPLGWDKYLQVEKLKDIFGGAMKWIEDRWKSMTYMLGMSDEYVEGPSILPGWREATAENIKALKQELAQLESEIGEIERNSLNADAAGLLTGPKKHQANLLRNEISGLEDEMAAAQPGNNKVEPIPVAPAPTLNDLKSFLSQDQKPQQIDQSKHVKQNNQFHIVVHNGPAAAGHAALSSIKGATDQALADTD